MTTLVVIAAVAIVAALAGALILAGFAWVFARLLRWIAPTIADGRVVSVASAVLPVTLAVLWMIDLIRIWNTETDLGGPDVQAIAGSTLFIGLLAIGGWGIGMWAARRAL